jgi:Ca-activated chloride channel family protein
MGVGYDVNSRLLDRLASDNFGRSEYVRPDEDIERVVKAVYTSLSAPVLTDVTIAAEFDQSISGPALQRLYPARAFDLFRDDTAIVLGRYRAAGAAKMTIKGSVQGAEREFHFPAEFAVNSNDDTNAFVAKLWASRRVGEIIDELDLKGENPELIEELVSLATEHGILTQYTSFMADDTAQPGAVAQNVDRASSAARRELAEADGEFGFNQRAAKQFFGRAGDAGIALGGRFMPAAPAAGSAASAETLAENEELSRLASLGCPTWYDAKANKVCSATNIVQVGRKTFFNRAGCWIDSSLSEDEINAARSIEQFSDEYFDLAASSGGYENSVLAMPGKVVVRLGDKVVSW